MKILFVCLGNICRSPMAEGILRDLTLKAQLDWHIDSAGTGAWHIGEQPDRRAIMVCAQRGIDIRPLRARQVQSSDLDQFDMILTMDEDNHAQVLSMSRTIEHKQKIKLMMSFSATGIRSVPDPYFDGRFEEVFELLNEVCERIVSSMK